MSCKNIPIPAAAEAAGFTKLTFCEDFETDKAIDFSDEGREGYSFYADRPYGMATFTPEECQMRDSVLYFAPEDGHAGIGLCSYSKKFDIGYTMKFGYAEARIRADLPTDEYDGWPAFWGMHKDDVMGRPWVRAGELDILEMYDPKGKGRSGGVRKDIIYTGTTHDIWRTGEIGENGRPLANECSSTIIACGYQDQFDYIDDQWHTYAALWKPGYIAWYMDGKLMHATTFNDTELPRYYYRDDTTPLPFEEYDPEDFDRLFKGGHNVMNDTEQVIILGAHKNWPMEVDWVRIWQ